jgi:hypothetical protein
MAKVLEEVSPTYSSRSSINSEDNSSKSSHGIVQKSNLPVDEPVLKIKVSKPKKKVLYKGTSLEFKPELMFNSKQQPSDTEPSNFNLSPHKKLEN